MYYEYLVMNRAGLLTRDDVSEYLSHTVKTCESIPDKKYQAADTG